MKTINDVTGKRCRVLAADGGGGFVLLCEGNEIARHKMASYLVTLALDVMGAKEVSHDYDLTAHAIPQRS